MKHGGPHFIVRVEEKDVSLDDDLEDALPTKTFFVTATVSETDLTTTEKVPSFTMSVSDRLPGHERFLDFLIEKGLQAWIRSRG
jgi:hypothetical protein